MLKESVHFLRGEVTLRVRADFPERVLNLCAARGIALREVKWESREAFTCRLSRGDHRRLRQWAGELDCVLETAGRRGVPFLLGRARRRQVLLYGSCICFGLLVLSTFFVWDYEIEGNVTVPEEEILRSLERNGVGLGTFGFSVDSEHLRNHVLLEIPELSWIAVNVSGCKAHVQVRERVEKPDIREKGAPANVVAARDGLVVEMRVLEGDKQVLPGTTVEEGQLLISGVEDLETTGARILSSLGQVWARTWRELTAEMPLRVTQKVYTGESVRKYSVIFGTKRIKFYGNGGEEGVYYDKIRRSMKLTLPGDITLPVTVVTEEWRSWTPRQVEITPTQAEESARALLLGQLSDAIGADGTISSAICQSQKKDGRLQVTLRAECVEQIGRRVEIPVEQTH